jgi:rubrerythrin
LFTLKSLYMSIKGSRTEKNLLKAFAGESQARNRYTYAAKIARKEGFEQIAGFFEETAEHELSHAKSFFKFLEGGPLEITATYPGGVLGTTIENLRDAANGESEEWKTIYPEFERIAREEGFKEIAVAFKMIAMVEAEHEKRFKKLLENITNDRVFERDYETKWKCRKCGFVHKGKKALENCPACNHPKAYFEEFNENY